MSNRLRMAANALTRLVPGCPKPDIRKGYAKVFAGQDWIYVRPLLKSARVIHVYSYDEDGNRLGYGVIDFGEVRSDRDVSRQAKAIMMRMKLS